MTTGRINQISWSRPPGPAPFRINNGRRRVPGGPEPPKGPGCNSVITWKGRTSARPPRQPPAHRGDARTWPSNCPHCSPSDTGPHAGCSTRPPWNGRCRGLRHTGLGWGVRTPRTRRRTAAPAGRLPPGIWVSGLASGQRSTDSIGAGDQAVPGLRSPQREAGGPAPSVIKPVKAARGRTATRLRWATCPRSRGGGHARSEPNAPPVTERQPAWQGRREKETGARNPRSPVRRRLPAVTPEDKHPS